MFGVSRCSVDGGGVEDRVDWSSGNSLEGVVWASRRVYECSRRFSTRVSLLLIHLNVLRANV